MAKQFVMDIFCGAGGFSEGFRQQGFKIAYGIDSWDSAIKTFNHNFNLNCEVRNILDFENNVEKIDTLPDTEVIVGSPPCISFSNSNRSGKADKSLGMRLTEVFLRIVVVKKFKPNSILKAWFMENVPNSVKYLNPHYSFNDLNLSEWSKSIGRHPNDIVISIAGNSVTLISAEFGSPQMRKRAISGEIVEKGFLVEPTRTHSTVEENGSLPSAITLGWIRQRLPKPTEKDKSISICDPLYPQISLPLGEFTDHFYDTGLYESQWENSKFMKRNHPYMGKMSFPENENNPSRTVTATNIITSREAIIYRSERTRKGNGEYRAPTIREMACLMGFPITFQFLGGGEGTKTRLVGNAVCPTVSRAIAKIVRDQLGLRKIHKLRVQSKVNTENIHNLNDFCEKSFNSPPVKKKGCRFRRHPFKYGNITVTLSNYDISNGNSTGKWLTSIQYGNGDGYPSETCEEHIFEKLTPVIERLERGSEFLQTINNGYMKKVADKNTLQEMYEAQQSKMPLLSPVDLVADIANLIDQFDFNDPLLYQKEPYIFTHKDVVPKKQVMALYAISKFCLKANSGRL